MFDAIPAPDHAILLGEAQEAAGGQAQAAEAAYAEGRPRRSIASRLRTPTWTGTELAVFEADHGSANRAVAAGERAWRLTPSGRAADAYSWALSAAGRDAGGDALLARGDAAGFVRPGLPVPRGDRLPARG